MALKIDQIINLRDYSDKEQYESPADRNIIEVMKTQAATIQNKQDVINALEEMKKIITSNKNNLDKTLQNTKVAQGFIKKEVDTLEEPNTLNVLYASGISSQILSICAAEYNQYYSRIQELQYRLNILSYKTIFIEQQQKLADQKIDLINKYIIALKELEAS